MDHLILKVYTSLVNVRDGAFHLSARMHFFGFSSVEVVLRAMNANQVGPRSRMSCSLPNCNPTQSELKRAKILARLPNGFHCSKVWCLSFHWKLFFWLLIKIELCEKKWIWMKIRIFNKRIHFSSNFKNPPKIDKKTSIFSTKKNKNLGLL